MNCLANCFAIATGAEPKGAESDQWVWLQLHARVCSSTSEAGKRTLQVLSAVCWKRASFPMRGGRMSYSLIYSFLKGHDVGVRGIS